MAGDSSDLGVGGSGVSGQMADDIQALSDRAKQVAATRQAAMEANTAQNLKAATTGQGPVKSLNDQVADQLLQHLRTRDLKNLDPVANRGEYMDELGNRIIEMEKQAQAVKKSGTGNMGAFNTYIQVANILKARLHAMQSQDVGAAPAEAQAPAAAATPTPTPVQRVSAGPGPMTFGGFQGR
jgi:uncharacterized protein involved in exopolysaccharide biosynthesis